VAATSSERGNLPRFLELRGATIATLKKLLRDSWSGPPPDRMVIHIGTNELGRNKFRDIREELELLWGVFLPSLSEKTEFLWSDILPRAGYPNTTRDKLAVMDRIRKDLNAYGRRLCRWNGGRSIRHPVFGLDRPDLYRGDGLHLADTGCHHLVDDVYRGLAQPRP
jgi:hypothetical protein